MCSGSSHVMCATSIESSPLEQGEVRSRGNSVVRCESIYILDGIICAMFDEILSQRAILVEGQSEMQRCVRLPYIHYVNINCYLLRGNSIEYVSSPHMHTKIHTYIHTY